MNTTTYRTLLVDTDPRAVTPVTLNRPDVMNAFDETMIAELTAVFEQLATAPSTRVVVLAAAGKAFSAGADLRWLERASERPAAWVRA